MAEVTIGAVPSREPAPAGFSSRTNPVALYGPLLLALYFVVTQRWGSYLTPGPPYIGDVLLAGLIVHRAWLLLQRSAPTPLLGRVVVVPTLLLIALALGTLATGEHSVTALRDAAPYLYAVLVLFGQSYREIPVRTVELLVYGALAIHAILYGAVAVFPSLLAAPTLGDSSIALLMPRGDIDGGMLGALAALSLDRMIAGRALIPSALMGGLALTLILTNESRAGLLASLCVIGFVVLRYALLWRSAGWRPAAAGFPLRLAGSWANCVLASLLVVAVTAGVTIASGSAPEAISRTANVVAPPTDGTLDTERVGDGPGSVGAGTIPPKGNGVPGRRPPGPVYRANSGVGTFRARKEAWGAALDWIVDGGADRTLLGVGFGPHYLQLSGADVLLLGPFADPAVRAIHNFAINTWARLGAVGLLLTIAIALLAVAAATRLCSRSVTPPGLDLLAAMLVIAIPVTALFGVVLEGPFGAIPYFWAVGYLSARMVEEGLWRPLVPAAGRSGSGA